MDIGLSIYENLAIFRYEKLRVIGVEGFLEKELKELEKLFPEGMEVAPVKKEPYRDFLAAFYFKPPVDFTIARDYHKRASIVTYSLDEDISRWLVEEMLKKSEFSPQKPTPAFIEIRRNEMGMVLRAYSLCQIIAQSLNAELEDVFGVVHYSNFLNLYKGIPSEERMKKAIEKFLNK